VPISFLNAIVAAQYARNAFTRNEARWGGRAIHPRAMSLSVRYRPIYNDQTMLCYAFSSHSSHFLLIFLLYSQVGRFAITLPSQTPVGMRNQNKQTTGNSSTDLSTGKKPASEIFQQAETSATQE
jgi:hypothetical protein